MGSDMFKTVHRLFQWFLTRYGTLFEVGVILNVRDVPFLFH